MAVAKVAAGRGGTTKAGCSLALLLFASVAGAQTTTPEAPPAAAESPARPAVPPKITYVGGQLRIDALGSTLAEVLTQVAALTGVNIDVPAGANSERMPVVELGPGTARQVLASLLSDSTFDYLIQSSSADPEKLQSVLLIPRDKKGSAPNVADATARPSRSPYLRAEAQPEAPMPDNSAPPQPEVAPTEAQNPTPPADQSALLPSAQQDPSASPRPGALSPPQTLTPQSMNQQLQQMYQQRMQMNQPANQTLQPAVKP